MHKPPPLAEIYDQREIERVEAYVEDTFNNAPHERRENPVVSWGDFAGPFEELERYKEPAKRAVLARRWHAVNGPQDRDVQPLPLGWSERSDVNQSGAGGILRWYARSLANFAYDIQRHPLFHDYACGILAVQKEGSQLLDELRDRFPPRELPGLDRATFNWEPPTAGTPTTKRQK
jgi:hypothetical protein